MLRQILKRTLGLFMGGVILACSAAGCGSGSRTEREEETPGNARADGHEPLTIVSYNNLLKEDFLSAFYEAYPEVELKVISYAGTNGSGYAMASLEHGDIPDIYISTQNFNKDAQAEYLLDLSNYDFVNNYSGALLDSMDVNGAIYLLPSGYQLTGIYYNKTILEEKGWKVPKSFNELLELSEKIEEAGYRTMGHGMMLDGFPFNYFFNIGNTVYFGTPEGTQWKKEFPAGEAKATGNSGLKETADYFCRWVEEGFITGEHTGTDQFYEGECVFFLCLGLSEYEHTAENGKTYEFGTLPWLSEDGSNNMLTRTVSRYMGINKSLADKGNEQKLEDALKLMDYISSVEGQKALMSGTSEYMLSLNEGELPKDSPYQEIVDLVDGGRTVPLVYVGWEQLIVPIAQDIKMLINGDVGVEGMIEAFDQTRDSILDGSSDSIYATAEETLTMEETARLVAAAEGKATGADCAMISLNEYHGNDLSNRQGLGWYLYQGEIGTEMVNMIKPRSATISVIELTGAEIRAMRDAGVDLDKNGNPYQYLLFTKGDMELEDTATYKLAISTGELAAGQYAGAVETEISPSEAIEAYLRELGTVTADAINWE